MSTKPATQPYIPPSQRDKAATSSPLPSPLSVRAAAPVSLRKQAFTLGRPPASQEEAPALASAHSQDRLSPISELPGHVCLCQPEPKIPRPRNGECCPLMSTISIKCYGTSGCARSLSWGTCYPFLTTGSVHSLSITSSGADPSGQPQALQSRGIQDRG
jgi:hypothetical protein